MGNEIRTEMSEGEKTRDIVTNFMDSVYIFTCLPTHSLVRALSLPNRYFWQSAFGLKMKEPFS